MLRAWLGPIEAWLARFDDGPQVQVSRMAQIGADLDEAIAPVSDVVWPLDASAAYRWGVSYVVEGSQLGGMVLYQRLKESLAPHPLRYLRGSAEGPGPRWRWFMLALKDAVKAPGDIDEACAGACDAFDRILALRA
jgi:heme oxygenase